jgi:hypothetical protein
MTLTNVEEWSESRSAQTDQTSGAAKLNVSHPTIENCPSCGPQRQSVEPFAQNASKANFPNYNS